MLTILDFKDFLVRCSLCALLCFSAPLAFSEELIFTYWLEALEPFAIRNGAKLEGGIVKDIGDELAARMELKPKYIELPTKRVAIMVTEGDAHISCLTNPKWEGNPENYHWSPVLFKGSDNFLIKQDQANKLKSIADLHGKRIGVYRGYVYSEQITALFEQGKAEPIYVGSLSTGIRLIEMGRLDTIIDFGSIIEYEIKKQGLGERFVISSMDADTFDFHCSYSLKIPYDAQALDAHLLNMKKEGFFEQVYDKYR